MSKARQKRELVKRPISVSQVELIFAISRHIEKHYGPTVAEPRTLNAMIQAANIIVEAYATPYRPVTDGMGLDAWRMSDEVGKSSEFMFAVLCGFGSREYAYPHDPEDFGRCVGLLRAEPRLRPDIGKLSDTGKEWAALVSAWDELEALYNAGDGSKLFDRMKELLEGSKSE